MAQKPKLPIVKIGDVVTFATIASKKLQATYMHKIIHVRHDLQTTV